MSEVRVKNTNPRTPVGLPSGRVIAPGKFADVPADEWAAAKSNAVVKAWLKRRVLVVEGDVPEKIETPAAAAPAPEPIQTATELAASYVEADEKDATIAALADYGIHKDRRMSLDGLRGLLADARAMHGAAPSAD